MGRLGLAGTGEAGFVEKATMELKPSRPAQCASASLARAVVKHTPHVNNRNISSVEEVYGFAAVSVYVAIEPFVEREPSAGWGRQSVWYVWNLRLGGGGVGCSISVFFSLYTSLCFLLPYSSPELTQ